MRAILVIIIILYLPLNAAADEWVRVWYGNLDQLPIEAEIGARISVDTYIQTSPNAYTPDMALAVGFTDEYIDSLLSETEGELFWPFTEWDVVHFTESSGSPPNPDGWRAESFVGFADVLPPFERNWLHLETPQLVLQFVVKSVSDSALCGRMVDAMGEGWDLIFGRSSCGDTLGGMGYPIIEYYSPVHFAGGGAISGIITDDQDTPIPGVMAQCRITLQADTSDANGDYFIDELYPGSHDIKFSHPTYVDSIVENVNVISYDTTSLDVTLQRSGYILGTVTDEQAMPLGDVAVMAINTSTNDTSISSTDESGQYYIDNIHNGTFDISFALPEYYDTTLTDITVTRGDSTEVNMQMTFIEIVDVGATSIISPPNYIETDYPSSIIIGVANYGNTPQLFDVIFEARLLYDSVLVFADTITTSELAPSTADTITFGSSFTSTMDTAYVLFAYSCLPGDNNAINDTVSILCVSESGIDIKELGSLPITYDLSQNYPNPFNARTVIEYALPEQTSVSLRIFDIQGHLVGTLGQGTQPAGYHRATWNSTGIASGIYFYKLQTPAYTATKRMLVIK
jgi:hypothetical protein